MPALDPTSIVELQPARRRRLAPLLIALGISGAALLGLTLILSGGAL